MNDRQLTFESLRDALDEMARLSKAGAPTSAAAWNWAQVLLHCAQSIEYSMTGFPQPKSPLFQRTVGAAAFKVFAWRKRMLHNLAEPIPGAPAIDRGADVEHASARLQRAIGAFEQWGRPLRPHFAYGVLSKSQYERAHAMHLANHFSVFRPGEPAYTS